MSVKQILSLFLVQVYLTALMSKWLIPCFALISFQHTFLSSGYQPIAIASVNLIAMSVITLVTAIVSASSVCCCRPDKKRHQVYKFDNIIESDGDVWSRRSMDTAITDIASWWSWVGLTSGENEINIFPQDNVSSFTQSCWSWSW